MQLREFYNQFLQELKPLYGYDESVAISNMLFEHFAGKTRSDIITAPDSVIEKEKVALLEDALLQLKRKVPVQYVIGHAWFAGLVFRVGPAVLIPRPETEELVQEAIQFIRANNKTTVLDIGTGSGCIPISIKKQLPAISVTAIDVSEAALAVAKENAQLNHVAVEWMQKDFLQQEEWSALPLYDVIISNPPYIPEAEKEMLDENVTAHEPHLALFVPDNDALLFYERIAVFAGQHLAAGGSIFMETHEAQAHNVAALFSANGFNTAVKKDINGNDRMLIANRNHLL